MFATISFEFRECDTVLQPLTSSSQWADNTTDTGMPYLTFLRYLPKPSSTVLEGNQDAGEVTVYMIKPTIISLLCLDSTEAEYASDSLTDAWIMNN